jgi:CheY-like chemotaxis protein
MALADHRSTIINELGTRQLRHDLLNSLNVLIGMTRILLDTEMTPTQRTCVQACRNAAERLLEMANHLDRYGQQAANGIDGPTQLADLCSIAAARVDKPFDRDTLLAVIERLAPVRSPRILLVDDAPEISVLVRAFLNGTRSVLDVVGDGERAVAQATSQPYDLVMMDVDLPGLDGATAAHAIRAADLARGASPTPIVALSAVGGQSQRNVEGLDGNEPAALNDPERAALLPGFIANRREDLHVMRNLVEQDAFEHVESIGRNMQGVARVHGVDAVSRAGGDIAQAAHRHDKAGLEGLLSRLEEYLSRVRVALPRVSG